ncbi:hypothetical protein FO519_003727 [Halicephalobus sp. NKZ332]|nr:hypothetical protein FO519_003727 [Halicephalobus sp. NKZ332]
MKFIFFLVLVGGASGTLVTDFQQIDCNILDNANVYLINKLDPEKAVEYAVIVDSEFESVNLLVAYIEDWMFKQNKTTQLIFYRWVQDMKRQSEIAKDVFYSKYGELDPGHSFYRTDLSQSEQSDIYRKLYSDLNLQQQKQLDQLYYQVYERSKFHFVTPNLDFDKYQRVMIEQNIEKK